MATAKKSTAKKVSTKTPPLKKAATKKAPTPRVDKQAQKEGEQVIRATLPVLVTLFLDKPTITPASLAKQPLSPAAALCLTIIGSSPSGCSETGIAMNLRGAYDREDAAKLARIGVADLRRLKLANWEKLPKAKKDVELGPVHLWQVELTPKGQKLYDTLKKNVLLSQKK